MLCRRGVGVASDCRTRTAVLQYEDLTQRVDGIEGSIHGLIASPAVLILVSTIEEP